MCASIREFGFKIPVLARSDGAVVDGHLRLKAARKLGITEVPVILCDEWAEAQVKAFRLMVNRSVAWADRDEELLSLELIDLKDLNFDLGLTGFEDEELGRLLAAQDVAAGLCDEDAALAPSQTPISVPGDLWLLGPHRLLCGDATDQQAVSRLLGEVKPMLMVTDPPYGVRYDPEWRNLAGVNNSKRMGKVSNDDRSDWREAWALFPGDVAYVWHGALHTATVARSLEACGFEMRSEIVWAKPSLVMGRGHYHWQHEPCWYAVRGTGHWNGDRKQSTLWSIENRNQDAATIHRLRHHDHCLREGIAHRTCYRT